MSLVLSRRRRALQPCCRKVRRTAALATKSHAPRGATPRVNADTQKNANIFASQSSPGSMITLKRVVMSVRRQHAAHHNERRRSAAGLGGALSSQSCNARSTRCLASTSGKIVHGWDWVRSASQPQADPQGFVGRSTARFLVCTARKRYHWCLQSYIHCSWHQHASVTKFERKRRAATAKIARLGPLSTLGAPSCRQSIRQHVLEVQGGAGTLRAGDVGMKAGKAYPISEIAA